MRHVVDWLLFWRRAPRPPIDLSLEWDSLGPPGDVKGRIGLALCNRWGTSAVRWAPDVVPKLTASAVLTARVGRKGKRPEYATIYVDDGGGPTMLTRALLQGDRICIPVYRPPFEVRAGVFLAPFAPYDSPGVNDCTTISSSSTRSSE